MQEWYLFQSHHCHCHRTTTNVEKVCISLELFMINYSTKQYVKENTSPNWRLLLLSLLKNHFYKILHTYFQYII
jgi:hypothetical protein